MAGFRDKLIHFYFGVKYELVWQAIKKRLPWTKGMFSLEHRSAL
ncbi:hypothetical protein BMS3Abin08_01076 [bacterium BMS3Abin08]|nr:hypothetical protein BMS3Abin08_01076 [bacterium BMS3Abin08]